jgi:hypothetical protein
MEGRTHLPRAIGTSAAIVAAACAVVLVSGAGLALAVGYVSILELAVVWALLGFGLSLAADPPGGRRLGPAVLWAVAALLLGGLPIILLAWRVGARRARAYEPKVSL